MAAVLTQELVSGLSGGEGANGTVGTQTMLRSKNGKKGTIERTVLLDPTTHGHMLFSRHLAGSHSISENSSYLSHFADVESSGRPPNRTATQCRDVICGSLLRLRNLLKKV